MFIPHGLEKVSCCVRKGDRRRKFLQELLHLSDSHGYAIRKERREVGDVGEREVSPGAPAGTDSSIEIKEELIQTRR